jgi:hypothetical protein
MLSSLGYFEPLAANPGAPAGFSFEKFGREVKNSTV